MLDASDVEVTQGNVEEGDENAEIGTQGENDLQFETDPSSSVFPTRLAAANESEMPTTILQSAWCARRSKTGTVLGSE